MFADRERLIGFAGAVLIHLALAGLLFFSMAREPETLDNPAVKPVIQATAVTEEAVMEPMRRRQVEQELSQQRIEEDKRTAAEAQRRTEEAKRQAAEEQKRMTAEKVRLAEQKKKEEAEKVRLAEQKKKEEAEKARLAEQEKQRKLEAEKQRKAAEEQKKAEEARKLQLAEEQRRRDAELKAKMTAEAERLAAEQQRYRQQQLLSARQQYMVDIRNKVERNWLRPTGSQGSHCRVLIHQIPGGDVVDVRLAECDGDVAFQRSVEAAVRKASPLPKPSDPDVFDREIEFVFEPTK